MTTVVTMQDPAAVLKKEVIKIEPGQQMADFVPRMMPHFDVRYTSVFLNNRKIELPKFKDGGNQGLLKTIMTRLVYPKEDCIEGIVVISFTVNFHVTNIGLLLIVTVYKRNTKAFLFTIMEIDFVLGLHIFLRISASIDVQLVIFP